MYVTYITYAVVVALIIWGGKFAWGKGRFNEDSSSLTVTKSLRGFAALGVILHHISQQGAFQFANGNGKPGQLSLFINAGFFFVAIFLFCSGFGLIKSLESKENYFDGFLKKRVLKTITIPFYINVVIYAIFHLIVKTKFAPAQWVTNFLGLTMMNEYAWYPIVLTILYLAFYFIFKNIKNQKIGFFLMFLVIFGLGVFFCVNGHFAWWAGEKNWWLTESGNASAKWWMQQKILLFSGEWWVNSAIAFLVGMIFGRYEEKIRTWFSKFYWLKLISIILLFIVFNFLSSLAQWKLGYWSEWSGRGPDILNKFGCYLSQLPQVTFFVIMVYLIMMKYYAKNPVLNFFGNVSFETYMMNLIAIKSMEFIIVKYQHGRPVFTNSPQMLALNEISIIALTIVLGLLYKFICNLATKKIKTTKAPAQPELQQS